MARKFFIEGWDNFSEQEKSAFQELVDISLRARELRFSLIDFSNDAADDLIDREFEITGNQDDPEAQPIMSAIPRVGSFLEVWRFFGTSSVCEDACDRQYANNEQKRNACKKSCRQRKLALVENFLNSGNPIDV